VKKSISQEVVTILRYDLELVDEVLYDESLVDYWINIMENGDFPDVSKITLYGMLKNCEREKNAKGSTHLKLLLEKLKNGG